MRVFSLLLIAAVCVTAMATLSVAAERTIAGMLVEAACGLNLGEADPSDEHVACMVRCAQSGDPIGILTDDGLYTITGDWLAGNGTRLADLMAEQVEATGEVSHEGGQLRINVATIKLAE